MKLFARIKEFFRKRKEKLKILSNLKYGDIIWCNVKRYQKLYFKEGHRLRPFMVIYVKGKYIYALMQTHVIQKTNKNSFHIERLNSTLIANILLKIKYNKFVVERKKQFNAEELDEVNRFLFARKVVLNKKVRKIVRSHVRLQKGDIVTYNNKSWIVRASGDKKVVIHRYAEKKNSNMPVYILSKRRVYVSSKPKLIFIKDVVLKKIMNPIDVSLIKILNEPLSFEIEPPKNKMAIGDLVSDATFLYIVKKITDNQVSAIKIVTKDEAEIMLEYKENKFYLLKNAVLINKDDLKISKRYGNKIIQAFEEKKREQKKTKKEIQARKFYHVGDVIRIEQELYCVIELYNEYMILCDENDNLSCEFRKKKYEIASKISIEEVHSIKQELYYTDLVRLELIVKFKQKKEETANAC